MFLTCYGLATPDPCMQACLPLLARGVTCGAAWGATGRTTGGVTCGATGGCFGAGPGCPAMPGYRSFHRFWAALSDLARDWIFPTPKLRLRSHVRRAQGTTWRARSIRCPELTFGSHKHAMYTKFSSSECIASGYFSLCCCFMHCLVSCWRFSRYRRSWRCYSNIWSVLGSRRRRTPAAFHTTASESSLWSAYLTGGWNLSRLKWSGAIFAWPASCSTIRIQIGLAVVSHRNANTSPLAARLVASAGNVGLAWSGSARAPQNSRTFFSSGMYVFTISQIPSSVFRAIMRNFLCSLMSYIHSLLSLWPELSGCMIQKTTAVFGSFTLGSLSSLLASSSSAQGLFKALFTPKFLALSDRFFIQSCNNDSKAFLWNSEPDAGRALMAGLKPVKPCAASTSACFWASLAPLQLLISCWAQ